MEQQYDERKRPSSFREHLTKHNGGLEHWQRYAEELETEVLSLVKRNRVLQEQVWELARKEQEKIDAGTRPEAWNPSSLTINELKDVAAGVVADREP